MMPEYAINFYIPLDSEKEIEYIRYSVNRNDIDKMNENI